MDKISNSFKEISNKVFLINNEIIELGDLVLYFVKTIQDEFKRDPRLLHRVIKLITEDFKFVKYPVFVNENGDIYFLANDEKYLISSAKNTDIKKSEALRVGNLSMNIHLNNKPNLLEILENFKDIILKEKSKLETKDKMRF
jgi:hypothetical protein